MVTDQYELFDYRTANYTENTQKLNTSLFEIQPYQGEVIFIRPKYKDRRYQNQRSIFSLTFASSFTMALNAVS